MSTEPHPTTNPTIQTNPNQNPYPSFHSYQFTTDQNFLSGLSNLLGHPGTSATEAELTQKPDLVLQAKCFYFNRKFQPSPPVDVQKYKAWLQNSQGDTTTTTSPAAVVTPSNQTTLDPPPPSATTTTSIPNSNSNSNDPPPPPYPTSFAAIVDLITQNKPIPGIIDVPDTVLELGSSKRDTTSRRRKPWEKEGTTDTPAVADGTETHQNDPSTQQTSGSNTSMTAGNGGAAETNRDQQTSVESKEEEESTTQRNDKDGVLKILRPGAVPDSGLIAKE